MAWPWSSWDEFVKYVNPKFVDSPGRLRRIHTESCFDTQKRLYEAVTSIERALFELGELGFKGDREKSELRQTDAASNHVLDLLCAGEELLLVHRRLAISDAAYGFLHSTDLIERWSRMEGTRRLENEIDQAIVDARQLLAGFYAMSKEDDDLLVRDLELPEDLAKEFYLARNLFSVGFDSVGVLIAGRGLEGVLRQIASRRGLEMVTKGSPVPAAECDLHDLIEVMYRIRWHTSKRRLISAETRSLLQYLKTVRNSHAHYSGASRTPEINPREKAAILARTADRLWSEVTATRAKLNPTSVVKDW